MPRHPREKSGTGIYHVMLRGVNRQSIFDDEEDCIKFINLPRSLVERFDDKGNPLPPLCTLYAYCLMDNHALLLVKEKTDSISSVMKRLAVSYAYYFNKKYGHYGHLFQDRFKSEPVNDIAYFMTLMRYLHQNPVKAGLCDGPSSYPWSSWQEYESENLSYSPICAVQSVFKKMSRNDILEQIAEPIEVFEDDGMSDESGKASIHALSDTEARNLLADLSGHTSICNIQSLPRKERNNIISSALRSGIGVRQLARLTGISYGVIQRINGKSN